LVVPQDQPERDEQQHELDEEPHDYHLDGCNVGRGLHVHLRFAFNHFGQGVLGRTTQVRAYKAVVVKLLQQHASEQLDSEAVLVSKQHTLVLESGILSRVYRVLFLGLVVKLEYVRLDVCHAVKLV